MKKILLVFTLMLFVLSCDKNRNDKDIVKEVKRANTNLVLTYYDNKFKIDNDLICLKNHIPTDKSDAMIKYFFNSIKKGNSTEETIKSISELYNIDYEYVVSFFYDYIIINKVDSFLDLTNLE